MCEDCEQLTIGDRNARMHAHLRSIDVPVKSGGYGWVINYRCDVCGEAWQFGMNPLAPRTGFHRGAYTL